MAVFLEASEVKPRNGGSHTRSAEKNSIVLFEPQTLLRETRSPIHLNAIVAGLHEHYGKRLVIRDEVVGKTTDRGMMKESARLQKVPDWIYLDNERAAKAIAVVKTDFEAHRRDAVYGAMPGANNLLVVLDEDYRLGIASGGIGEIVEEKFRGTTVSDKIPGGQDNRYYGGDNEDEMTQFLGKTVETIRQRGRAKRGAVRTVFVASTPALIRAANEADFDQLIGVTGEEGNKADFIDAGAGLVIVSFEDPRARGKIVNFLKAA